MHRNLLRQIPILIWVAVSGGLVGADVSTISYPYLGVTHIARTGSAPEFPRDVKMHVVKIDTHAPSISFRLTPRGGSRDTVRRTTLESLIELKAQIAANASYYLPFPSKDTDSELVGFAASNGDIFSPFESPKQNYAIVRDAPAINIDPNNNLSIVHRDPAFSDGTCHDFCDAVDGLHVAEKVKIWNAFSGSAQIVTNGVKTIPCYVDAEHPNCQLIGPGPRKYSNANSWYELVNARTAIGIGCDHRTLVLFTVDAKNGSAGMKVSEVADLLIRDYGVCDALNMDGGGSTSLAMADPETGTGSFVNTSSDNPKGRSNGSSLAVFAVRDWTAPRTTATILPAPDRKGRSRGTVAVTLRAGDNPGGVVKQIEYALSGAHSSAERTVNGESVSIPLTNPGETVIRFFATDRAGNVEPAQTLRVKIHKR